jgi:hypothetical protein
MSTRREFITLVGGVAGGRAGAATDTGDRVHLFYLA